MAIFFTSSNFKRKGPQHAKDNANAIVLVKNPNKADDWATFQSKIVAQAPITGADIALTDIGDDLQFSVNGKADIDQTATAEASDDICMTVVDTVNEEVMFCTDATDRVVTNETGDRIDLPAITHFVRESKVYNA